LFAVIVLVAAGSDELNSTSKRLKSRLPSIASSPNVKQNLEVFHMPVMGYSKIAEIDLTSRKVTTREVDEKLAYDHLGGRGWAASIIFERVSVKTKPLDPKNMLVVAAGPLTIPNFLGGSKTTFASISPQTGIYGDSNVGGFFGHRLKRAGYDALIISGASKSPVYLSIIDGEVTTNDAKDLWGKSSKDADHLLRRKHGEDSSIATIGIAGENLVNFACVNIDWDREKTRHGQAGRTGTGAIMGAKKLKAIVAKGSKDVAIAHPDRLSDIYKRSLDIIVHNPTYKTWMRQGTMSVIEWANEVEALPTLNFQKTQFEKAKEIGGDAMEKTKIKSRPCSNCPVPCEHVSRVKDEDGRPVEIGVEYENAALLGSNLGLPNISDVARANYVTDELGLDTISAGGVIAFVLEAYQRGLITKRQLGFEPRFGDLNSVLKLLAMIAERKGFGDAMADGTRALAQKIGKGSIRFAMQVKGLEISGYDLRAAPAMALSYATTDIGAHHNRSWAITYDIEVGRDGYGDNKVDRVIYLQHLRPLFDMLGVCRFHWVELGMDPKLYAEAYSAVTGKEFTLDELLKRSERTWNLTRVMAILRKGISAKDDMPPERDFTDPIPAGKTAGTKLDRQKFTDMLQRYYEKRGWDEEGRPTREKLNELGLTEAATRLYG
jgi:aldehyde:ferredoxin oxidoreductase